MTLNYILDPNNQYQSIAGVNNTAGFIRVYDDGTDDPAITYSDFSGTMNPRDIRIDNNGRAVVIADSDKAYRVEVYSASGALLWTQHPVFPQGGGGGSFEQVQSDWSQSNSSAVDFIRNKPNLGNFLEKTGDGKNVTVTFNEASERTNVGSGEKLSVLFGKIKKWLSDLKTVAFSGSYNDLSDKPSIPSAQVQSDWAQSNSSAVDFIKNKPSIPDVSGKLNINGDNATAPGSRAIVDKISYNDDPTIDDNSKILQKNVEGWAQVDFSAYLGYLTTEKHFPIMESVSTRVSKTVASGEENAITLGNVNLPTRKTRFAIAIVTVQFKVDSNYGQIDLSQVSREAEFSLEDTGSSNDVPMVLINNSNDLKSCVTFQMSLAPAYYPSSLEANVYFLNAPIGVSLSASVRITTLGTGQFYVNN